MNILIAGVGSIGGYLAGRLAASSAQIYLYTRPARCHVLQSQSWRISDYLGFALEILPSRFVFYTQETLSSQHQATQNPLKKFDLILITVKSEQTAEITQEILNHFQHNINKNTVILSFQNGVNNTQVINNIIENNIINNKPKIAVISGIVPFNVIQKTKNNQTIFHQGSEGNLECDAILGQYANAETIQALFKQIHLPMTLKNKFMHQQWGKLLLNLNNPINALSNLTLQKELSQKKYRQCLALAQREALFILKKAKIQPAKITPLPPFLLPKLLTVSDFLFQIFARKMLEIDPLARSSMWEDIQAGRKTEINYINGEIVKLAEKLQMAAPINQKLIALIRQLESEPLGQKNYYSGEQLLAALRTQ